MVACGGQDPSHPKAIAGESVSVIVAIMTIDRLDNYSNMR